MLKIENKEFNQNSERYKTIWKNIHNLVNNEKIKKNAIDTIYSDRQIKEIKSNTLCFEFLYNHVFVVDNCKAGFDGIFFLFDNHCLVYGYYSINTYIDDSTKEKQYTNFWKIEEQKNTVEKIKQLQLKVQKIINDYSSISEISDKEKGVIYAMLNYPLDFINISKGYYLKQKSWDYEVFLSRFKDKVENDIFKSELLRNIDKNLK